MKFKTVFLYLFYTLLCCSSVFSQQDTTQDGSELDPWYKSLKIRGYSQFRLNQLYQSNSNLQCEQCDAAWGGNNGFSFRRIRLIFFGNVTNHIYFYIQPDFAASGPNNTLQYAQIRDAYFDIGVDKKVNFDLELDKVKFHMDMKICSLLQIEFP